MVINPVKVEAVDWSIYHGSEAMTKDFTPCLGVIIGNLIRETEESLVIAFETFADDGDEGEKVRCVLVIPRQCVKLITYLVERVE